MSLALFITMVIGPTSANGLIGNLETDVPIYGLSELGTRTLVSRYFAQRKAYLQGTEDTINIAITPVVADEADHKAALAEANAVLENSTVVINSVIVGEYFAEVNATETVTFVIDGETVQESVSHLLYVCEKNDGALIVGSDGYEVTTIGFQSATYIDTNAAELMTIRPDGSPECILEVAYNELGTAYPLNEPTKYGCWYADLLGITDPTTRESVASQVWCAMFVSWCAYQANIPEYVILYHANSPDIADFFRDEGQYHPSLSQNGNYTPQPGDIIFTHRYDTYTDSLDSPGHVGIVKYVANGKVYFIDGNRTTTIDGVSMKSVLHNERSLSDPYILAYGHPAYALDSHYFNYWEYDDSMHWSSCMV